MGSLLTAGGCDSSGGQRINIHGDNFHVSWADPTSAKCITVNGCGTCTALKVESRWLLSCRLPTGVGSGHMLLLDFGAASQNPRAAAAGPPVISILVGISYAAPSNQRDVFQNVEQYGVGGLMAEIREIYRRVFQSRSLPRHIVDGLGVSHVKGVLLHGSPRLRQDAYARIIALLAGTSNVNLVNTTEIMQKFLGESEVGARRGGSPHCGRSRRAHPTPCTPCFRLDIISGHNQTPRCTCLSRHRHTSALSRPTSPATHTQAVATTLTTMHTSPTRHPHQHCRVRTRHTSPTCHTHLDCGVHTTPRAHPPPATHTNTVASTHRTEHPPPNTPVV